MTMYLPTNNDVEDALIALHKAGKDVKVVLNKNFLRTAATTRIRTAS